jgi:hypothetical protein
VFIRTPRPLFKQVREGYLLFLKNSHARGIARAIQHICKDAAKRATAACNTANGYRALHAIEQVGINRGIARGFPYLISDAYLYVQRHGTMGEISAEASSA